MKPAILVVDDEPATLFGFSRYLTKAGYSVSEAGCLSEAREALMTRRFDVVILDMILPDGNGIDWIRDIRKLYKDVAIVVITGKGDVQLAVEAMHRGADNFLTKPVSLLDLDDFIRKSLELGALRRKSLAEERLSHKIQPHRQEDPAGNEEDLIKKFLERAGGDVGKAADAMGISKATLCRKIKKFRNPH